MSVKVQAQLLKALESAPSIEAFFNDLSSMLRNVCKDAGVDSPEGFAALETAKRAFAKFDD